MYPRARLLEIREEDNVQGEEVEGGEAEVENVEGGDREGEAPQQHERQEGGDVGGGEENVVILEITREQRHALNEQRLKMRHERPPQSGIHIRSEASGGERESSRRQPTGARPPASTQSGSRQECREINSRKKMMSKGKGVAQYSESDTPSKKQKTTQEGLDEDILNLLSEASRNETSLLRSQIMQCKREKRTEREVTMLKEMVLSQNLMIEALKKTAEKLSGIKTELQSKIGSSQKTNLDDLFHFSRFQCDIGSSGGSGGEKDVQGSSGAKDKTMLKVIDEGDEDDNNDDDDGDDNPDKDKSKGDNDQGQGEGGTSGAGGAGGTRGATDTSGDNGIDKSGDSGHTGVGEGNKDNNLDGDNTDKGTI
ncbi:hypothetical protein L1987_23254 [Smallanthus sonchifolius]|uniref:Uncharacterized protein n=1 Tax=Smallanthus sonchifolius TaxID=185202 RepID=A0ACB9II22_9ASTR|nr:hypothetical protein L1987_23254 [Smallanthus sonchifolius]